MARSAASERRMIAEVPCDHCGAAKGEPCHNPAPQDAARYGGRLLPQDRRPQPHRSHTARRTAWSDAKRGVR